MRPYRTLIWAELVQEAPLSTGGNAPHQLVDLPLARDGRERPILRGTTLAGSFLATARAIFGDLPTTLTKDWDSQQDSRLTPSAWRFAHAHLLQEDRQTAFFQHVSIDPRTQAAKDDHLFSLEALPPGTRWHFELEISPPREGSFSELEAMAAAVLAEWQQPGGVCIGRGGRHGYGWCHLENIRIVRLTTEHLTLWPDAISEPRSPAQWAAYFQAAGVEVLDLQTFLAGFKANATPFPAAPSPKKRDVHVCELTGIIEVGERSDDFGSGYGLDALSIGGHAQLRQHNQAFVPHLLEPRPQDPEQWDPDFHITSLRAADGRMVPYIPGASIRGVWRNMLTRHAHAIKQDLDQIEALFGSTEQAGQLWVANATLEDEDFKLLWQQHVAIDELTGGVYGAAKFDRLCIARARFRWRAKIVGETEKHVTRQAERIITMLDTLGEGHLPLGGGIWQGLGHVRWKHETLRTRTIGA